MKRELTETQMFRAQDLLLARATVGLSDAEAAELAALGADEDLSFDLAAAAIDLATLDPRDLEAGLPPGLADKVLGAAGVPPASMSMSSIPTTLAGVMPPRPLPIRPAAGPPEVAPVTSLDEARAKQQGKKRSRAAVIGWLAAAACLALAAGAWLWASGQKPDQVATVPVEPPPAEARAKLLASAKDAATLAWTATPDPAAKGATGDVVWSASEQRGYMRFVGLAPNDRTQLQYQLWIFDKDRDEKFPVDGGVFDVSSTGEVIVPISAKLRVTDATLFAVTVEKPGGVVVSKRERIVVTAAPRAS
ncbi:MAG: anti-sigma factor [Deltaproteobacteria bacterium]|nr:anti-sigma factor [Deltaproteobacteria bacterium]